MSTGNVFVQIVANMTAFEDAMRRVAEAMRQTTRPLWRLAYTPGDRHIERIVRDCMARRLDRETTARRLMVASDIAAVLDRSAR